jgi:hypothetical protein
MNRILLMDPTVEDGHVRKPQHHDGGHHKSLARPSRWQRSLRGNRSTRDPRCTNIDQMSIDVPGLA